MSSHSISASVIYKNERRRKTGHYRTYKTNLLNLVRNKLDCKRSWYERKMLFEIRRFEVNVSILKCTQTRFSRPRLRTRPSLFSKTPTSTTTGWLFASGSSWTLRHTGGSRQDTHGTLVPAREGRGWPTRDDFLQTTRTTQTSVKTNVLSAGQVLVVLDRCWRTLGFLQ